MKYKKKWHEILVCTIIVFAGCMRILLASVSWPLPNSDESTVGIMAMHIQQGERPIFFYGQNYMGSLEAYIAAALFYPFGISVFALKLAVVLLFMLFLISMYFLTRMLYGKNLALYSVLLLSLGSNAVLSRQLSAIGGYTETLLFAALLFLLTGWLVLSSEPVYGKRLAGFSAWGLVSGLALWSDLLILPVIGCTGLILILFCRRELMRGAIIGVALCFIVGASPLIVYNIHAAPRQDSWSLLMGQQTFDNVPHTATTLNEQITKTLEISLPTITGSPFCHYAEFPQLALLGFEQSRSPDASCQRLNWSWSIAYLLLFCLSCVLATLALAKAYYSLHSRMGGSAEKQELKRWSIHLLLLFNVLITLVAYIHSNSPLLGPAILARYLICLWIAVPALLWPIQVGIARMTYLRPINISIAFTWLRSIACLSLLLVIIGVFLLGSWETLGEVPQARAHQAQEHRLIAELTQLGVTHVYSDYWTCDDLAFQSKERILCAVLRNSSLQPGQNRYMPYFVAVSHTVNAAYLVPAGSGWDTAIKTKLLQQNKGYHVFSIENYTVYQPVS